MGSDCFSPSSLHTFTFIKFYLIIIKYLTYKLAITYFEQTKWVVKNVLPEYQQCFKKKSVKSLVDFCKLYQINDLGREGESCFFLLSFTSYLMFLFGGVSPSSGCFGRAA